MKRLVAIILAVLICVCSFSACSKSNDNEQTETTTIKTGTYYDQKGNVYSTWLDVLYYTRDGQVYKLEPEEDLFPVYVNQETGESIDSFSCYIDKDGYFFYDENDILTRQEKSLNTYLDPEGNEYYDISTVMFDQNGNIK